MRPVKTPVLLALHSIFLLCAILGFSGPIQAETASDNASSQGTITQPSSSKIRSSEDGWLDISEFVDQAYGFVPLVIPITEPAVGFGGVGALAFIDKQQHSETAGFGRPNITVIGGMKTENGTSGVMAGDVRHWLDDRMQTLIGIVHASINLDFQGIGLDRALENDPRTYNMETIAGVTQAKYRLGDTRAWLGIGYALANTTIEFDVLPTITSLPNFQRQSRVGGITPSFSYDSRDNIFTPSQGQYLNVSAGLFSRALGSDTDFQRVNLTGIQYLPLNSNLTLGLLGSATFSFGDVPFYLSPFILMRGVAAMKYQGESSAQIEAELRWQFWQRFSLVGFAGAGSSWNDFEHFEKKQNVATGGFGFRYELARKYGMHMGLDIAYGPDGPAYYIQFGSAWMRP